MANTFSSSYPTVWAKYLAKTLDAAAIMLPTVSRSVEASLAKEGNVATVNKFGDVTVSDYTPGTDLTVQDVSVSSDTLTLNQFKTFNFIIDKVEDAFTHLDLTKGFISRAGVAMAQTLDTRLLSHYADVDAGNIIGTNGAPVSVTPDNVFDYFIEARRLLVEDNVIGGYQDQGEKFYSVIDPDTEAQILKSPRLKEMDAVIKDGKVMRLAGFDLKVSNRIATVSNVKNLMFYHPEFISLAVRIPLDYIKQYDPERRFGTGVKGLSVYGSKVFNPKMGVVLKKSTNV